MPSPMAVTIKVKCIVVLSFLSTAYVRGTKVAQSPFSQSATLGPGYRSRQTFLALLRLLPTTLRLKQLEPFIAYEVRVPTQGRSSPLRAAADRAPARQNAACVPGR